MSEVASFFGDGRISIVRADITELAVDLIVNAANPTLLGGGGVDGAIHRVAGPELLAACRSLGGAAPGEAKLTPGFGLPARWVAHAVGPVWQGGHADEDALLRRCYRACLALAVHAGAVSVAFPAISTGAYGFPLERATRLALATVQEHIAAATLPAQVVFCCFRAEDVRVYDAVARDVFGASSAGL